MKFNELQKTVGTLIVERAQLEIGTTRTIRGRKVRRVASDKLRKGLSFVVNGKNIGLTTDQDHGEFIHYGVNGTKQKFGSQFSFGTKQPPSEPILRWMKQKGVRVRTAEGAFAKQTESAKKGLAFVIARSVKEKGIVPLPYYDMAIKYAFQTQQDLIEKALVKDIELNLDL